MQNDVPGLGPHGTASACKSLYQTASVACTGFQHFNALPYRVQAKETAVNLIQAHPLQLLDIIVGTQDTPLLHTAQKKHIHGRNIHT